MMLVVLNSYLITKFSEEVSDESKSENVGGNPHPTNTSEIIRYTTMESGEALRLCHKLVVFCITMYYILI